jgi:hypothetical protein
MPDIERTEKKPALKRSPFTVYQDATISSRNAAAYAPCAASGGSVEQKHGVMSLTPGGASRSVQVPQSAGASRRELEPVTSRRSGSPFSVSQAICVQHTSCRSLSLSCSSSPTIAPVIWSGINSCSSPCRRGVAFWERQRHRDERCTKHQRTVKGVRIEVEKAPRKSPFLSSLSLQPAKRAILTFAYTPDGRARSQLPHSRSLAGH